MGKFVRFLFFAPPWAATIAALVCIVLIGAAGLDHKSIATKDFYFLKADTTRYKETELQKVLPKGATTAQRLGQADYATISLWNYCFKLDTNARNRTGSRAGLYCSKPSIHFSFDPVEIWDLRNPANELKIPEKTEESIRVHASKSKWIIAGYGVAFVFLCLEVLAGFGASYHRWGSIVVTVVACISSVSFLIASVLATASFAWIRQEMNSHFHANIFSLGGGMFATTWLGSAFALASAVFWFLTFCACSRWGNDKQKKNQGHKYVAANKRLDPMGHEEDHDANPLLMEKGQAVGRGGAYEPYRSREVLGTDDARRELLSQRTID